MTPIDSRSVARRTGLPAVTRTAESPRPIPHTVRLPYISLSVAKTDAVTVQSRVAGFVTMGPTLTRRVLGEDRAVDGVRLLPQQVRVERPHVAEPVLLGELRERDGPRRGRVGLQDSPELHVSSPFGAGSAFPGRRTGPDRPNRPGVRSRRP